MLSLPFSGACAVQLRQQPLCFSPRQAGCPECLQSGAPLPRWRALFPPWKQLSQHLPALPGRLGEWRHERVCKCRRMWLLLPGGCSRENNGVSSTGWAVPSSKPEKTCCSAHGLCVLLTKKCKCWELGKGVSCGRERLGLAVLRSA